MCGGSVVAVGSLTFESCTPLALDAVAWQGTEVLGVEVLVDPEVVTVTLTGEVELGLLGVFVDQSQPLTVRASASALPVLVP